MAIIPLSDGLRILESRKHFAALALLVSAIAGLGMDVAEILELNGMANIEAIELDPVSTVVAGFYFAALVTMIVTIVLVCFWTYRAHANLVAAGYEKQFTPGWAVGWYFIPFANLVMPFRATRELWNLSHGLADSQDQPAPSELTAWWACWIVGNILSNVGLRLEASAFTVGLSLGIIGTLLSVASAWLLRAIIIRITDAQRGALGVLGTFS